MWGEVQTSAKLLSGSQEEGVPLPWVPSIFASHVFKDSLIDTLQRPLQSKTNNKNKTKQKVGEQKRASQAVGDSPRSLVVEYDTWT